MENGKRQNQLAAIEALIRANDERLARTRAAMASVDAHLHLTEEKFQTPGAEPPKKG